MKNQQGTSLVEVLVSVMILGIVGVGFIWGMTTITKTTPLIDDRSTALSLAESQMEYIRNQPYGWDYDTIDTPTNVYIGTPMAFQFDANGDGMIDAEDDSIQKIEIKILVPDPDKALGRKMLINLEGYRTL